MQRDTAYLLDVAHAARLIQEFVVHLDFESFLQDEKTRAATLHEFLILGESINRLSEEFIEAHPEIEWRQIVGMRNRLIHEYDRVDLKDVWESATRDIPNLIRRLAPLLPPGPE